jgi:hypothetical protein
LHRPQALFSVCVRSVMSPEVRSPGAVVRDKVAAASRSPAVAQQSAASRRWSWRRSEP